MGSKHFSGRLYETTDPVGGPWYIIKIDSPQEKDKLSALLKDRDPPMVFMEVDLGDEEVK